MTLEAQICSSLSFTSNSPFGEVTSFSLEKDVHSCNERSSVVKTNIWEKWSPAFEKNSTEQCLRMFLFWQTSNQNLLTICKALKESEVL